MEQKLEIGNEPIYIKTKTETGVKEIKRGWRKRQTCDSWWSGISGGICIKPHHDNNQLPIRLTQTMAIFLSFWSSETPGVVQNNVLKWEDEPPHKLLILRISSDNIHEWVSGNLSHRFSHRSYNNIFGFSWYKEHGLSQGVNFLPPTLSTFLKLLQVWRNTRYLYYTRLVTISHLLPLKQESDNTVSSWCNASMMLHSQPW